MEERKQFEVVIIGGGIAGASLAYFLTERGLTDVLVAERESQPGVHSTGRSAAVLAELEFIPAVHELILRSAEFLRNPPPGFTEERLLKPTGILVVFREPLWGAVRDLLPALEDKGTAIRLLSPSEVVERVPVLSRRNFDGAVLLPEDGHLDVHELLWSYLRHARRRGAELRCNLEVKGIRVQDGRCRAVLTDRGEIRTRWVVNAAGAWAGQVAAMAGAAPIRLIPYRRTMITFRAPGDLDVRGWPLISSVAPLLYFGPESGGLLASPMDEDPVEPCDAQPDELVVAETVERLRRLAPRLVPRTLRSKWAGLRTFAEDHVCVVGEDPAVRGFFWLAGQGGSGIESSPEIGRIAADLLIDGETGRTDAQLLAPSRFRE